MLQTPKRACLAVPRRGGVVDDTMTREDARRALPQGANERHDSIVSSPKVPHPLRFPESRLKPSRRVTVRLRDWARRRAIAERLRNG